MTVYVLEIGESDNRSVQGVFWSLDAARTSCPASWGLDLTHGEGVWFTYDANQNNDCGFITPHEVQG